MDDDRTTNSTSGSTADTLFDGVSPASEHRANHTALHVPLVSDPGCKCGVVQYSMACLIIELGTALRVPTRGCRR